MFDKQEKLLRLCLFGLAIVLHGGAYFYALLNNSYLYDDSVQFLTLANHLTDGTYTQSYTLPGVADTQRTPGYPFFLWLTGGSAWLTLSLQHFLVFLTARYLYKTAALFSTKKIAQYVGIFYLLQPYPTWFASAFLSETLFIFFLIYSFYKFCKYITTQTTTDILLSSIALGFVIYIKSLGLVLIFVYIAFALVNNGLKIQALGRLSLNLILPLVILLSPWYYRNYLLLNRLSFSTLGDTALWYGKMGGVLALQQHKEIETIEPFLLADSTGWAHTSEIYFWKQLNPQVKTQETATLVPEVRELPLKIFITNPYETFVFHVQSLKQMAYGVGYHTALKISESTLVAYCSAALQFLFNIAMYIGLASYFFYLPKSVLNNLVFSVALVLLLAHCAIWADGRYRMLADPFMLLLLGALMHRLTQNPTQDTK